MSQAPPSKESPSRRRTNSVGATQGVNLRRARRRSSHETESAAPVPPARASGIPVWCKFDRLADPEELNPHPDNAHRTHPPKQLDRYEKVIAGTGKKPGNGWRKSVVVSARSGFITKGHGAWLMAKRRGWQVPVEIQAYASLAEERRDLVADNKLADEAVTDDAKLAALLAELDAADLELAGFSAGELERMVRETDAPDGEFPITAQLGESYDYVLIFTQNDTDFAFLQDLLGVQRERSYKKTGVGLGRAIPLARALEALRQNRHSLDVAGRDDDHAPAGAKRRRRGAGKPAG